MSQTPPTHTSKFCSPNSELFSQIKSRAINNDIIVSFSNFSFTDFALNWVKSLEKLKITNFLIFALDQKSYNFFVERNICSYLLEKSNKLFTEESHNFGSVEFIAICNEKPFIVHEILKAGFNVVWSDTDIVWLRVRFFVLLSRSNVTLCVEFFLNTLAFLNRIRFQCFTITKMSIFKFKVMMMTFVLVSFMQSTTFI
jgi:hypothetical protein